MTKTLLRRMVLSSLDYYTHHISRHTIPSKMTKLFSKLKLFLNSPGNYHNHRPNQNFHKNKLSYFPVAQEAITIIDPARIDLKNKLNYSPTAQETITIIDPARIDLKNKLSYSQLVTQAYQGRHLWGPGLFILKKN